MGVGRIMGSRRARVKMLDFCYDYIQKNGMQTTKDLIEAYMEQDLSMKKTGLCNNKELAQKLSRNRLFFREKEDFGRYPNKSKIYKYNIRDVDEVARKLASLTHMQTDPKHFPRVLRDAYNACVAEQKSLRPMDDSVGIRE